MVTALPARVEWAIELLAPLPNERVLEIGCGTGVAAERICAGMTTGRMLAVDRSPVAVAATSSRAATAIDRGVLEVSHGTLSSLTVDDFDLAFAINVNVFWTTPAEAELAVLSRALRPGGRLGILFGTGPHDDGVILPLIAGKLERHGFCDVRLVTDARGSGVIGRR